MALLTFKEKHITQSVNSVNTTSVSLVDDTEASLTFSLTANQTVLIVYQANNNIGDIVDLRGLQYGISKDGSDVANTWDCPGYNSNYPTRGCTFWVGTLGSGSHTIKGRFARNNSTTGTVTITNRILLVYIFDGDEFQYIDSNTESLSTSNVLADDPQASVTFTPTGNCKALYLYNAANSYFSGVEDWTGKKIAISVAGIDYAQAEKSNYNNSNADGVFTCYANSLTAVSTTIKGRFARNGSTAGTVTITRRQLGVLLLDNNTILDIIDSIVQVNTTSNTLVDDAEAVITKSFANGELLLLCVGTKRNLTSSSGQGERYGISLDSSDKQSSRGCPYDSPQANSAGTVWAQTIAAGSHTIKGRVSNNSSTTLAKIDARVLISFFFPAAIPPTQKTILSDATIVIPPYQKEILSDAEIRIPHETILSDAKIFGTNQKTIFSDAKIIIEALYNITQKFYFTKQALSDVNNKFTSVIGVLSNINNFINTVIGVISDVNNDFRTKKLVLNNVANDIRFLYSWQKAANGSLLSLGKTYITISIGGVLQTDIDVDSINISKGLNSAHSATFDLGRAYDTTKPAMEATVVIKYNNWVLYSGYITQISPADGPEKIRINCQDEYWKQNQENVYYNIGHKPLDDKELYYSTLAEGLTVQHGWTLGIGNYVPETLNNFAVGKSEAISNIIQECGNYGWFYDVSATKRLWAAGQGASINLQRQSLGENIKLYDVISHSFDESVEGIVNKYRVQMGNLTVRKFARSGGGTSITYTFKQQQFIYARANSEWDQNLESLSKDNSSGFGYDKHPPEENAIYQDVFRKYDIYLPPPPHFPLAPVTVEISPIFEAYIIIRCGGGTGLMNMSGEELDYYTYKDVKRIIYGKLYNGFTIDYKNEKLILSEPIYTYCINSKGECEWIRSPRIELYIGSKYTYTYTEDGTENPETDVSNPLMFFTDKMGDYPTTVLKQLNLTQFSIQQGFIRSHFDYVQDKLIDDSIPSWDDTNFAKDYANWELSKNCDKKIKGNIEITLDAMCFYGIDLSKRIYIAGITDEPMNITEISYNISSFTVKLTLENSRYYNRTVSLPYHGE